MRWLMQLTSEVVRFLDLDPDQRGSLGLLPTISHSRQEIKNYVLMQKRSWKLLLML